MKNAVILISVMLMVSGSAAATLNPPGSPTSDFQILFICNSHSAVNSLPDLVTTLIETGMPGKTASSGLADGIKFLDERLTDGITRDLLESRDWTHVVLQAQKYSSSGKFFYSTAAAEQWIRRVKAQKARAILFPEWPRRGNTEEGQRIHNLHLGISSRESACVAPIGLAWEESIARYPGLSLHATDGNHSNLRGALLTAYVLYHVTTGQSAAELPYIPAISVDADTQQDLREVASFVVISNQTACTDIKLTSDSSGPSVPGIPTLNHWGLLILILSMMIIGIRLRQFPH